MEKKRRNRVRPVMVLVFLLSTLISEAQLVHITGVVTDRRNQHSLAGVSVTVERTGVQVLTDSIGTYSLNVVKGDTLVFCCLDFITRRGIVKDNNRMDVGLNPVGFVENWTGARISKRFGQRGVPEKTVLDVADIVVVGMGRQKKVSIIGALSGAVSSVTQVSASERENS